MKVSSTGFFETESKTSTGQARLYDARTLKLYAVRSLDDLLQAHQPGVLIGEHERTSRLIGVRGVLIDNNAKTLVMVDGVNTNMRAHFGAIGSTLAVPLTGDIERVEVILGPGAIVHGSGAISGFVNVLRPTGITRPGLWGKASYASGAHAPWRPATAACSARSTTPISSSTSATPTTKESCPRRPGRTRRSCMARATQASRRLPSCTTRASTPSASRATRASAASATAPSAAPSVSICGSTTRRRR